MIYTDRDLKDKEEIDEIIYRGNLLTSRERQLAEAKAEVLRMSGEVERIRTEARVAKQEARELREHVAAATRSFLPSPRTALKALAVVVMLSAILRLAYVGYTRPTSATPPLESLNRLQPPSPRPAPTGGKSAGLGSQEFKQAMSRLQDDLDSLPGTESEIVQEVNQKHLGGNRPCPLEWVNGQSALSLDADGHRLPPSLTTAVTGCADAVEQLRSEKEAILRSAADR